MALSTVIINKYSAKKVKMGRKMHKHTKSTPPAPKGSSDEWQQMTSNYSEDSRVALTPSQEGCERDVSEMQQQLRETEARYSELKVRATLDQIE